MNKFERNVIWKIIGKIVGAIVGIALVFVLGIVIACNANGTTFTIEWNNMLAWFATWAK